MPPTKGVAGTKLLVTVTVTVEPGLLFGSQPTVMFDVDKFSPTAAEIASDLTNGSTLALDLGPGGGPLVLPLTAANRVPSRAAYPRVL